MQLEEDLLETAQRLLQPRNRRGRPKQADLRRAISTAYYAVFHALCRMCADALVGMSRDARNAWQQVYRAVEHGCTKDRCQDRVIKNEFPSETRLFCAIFLQLQEKRHAADYDPFEQFLVKDAEQVIEQARMAISYIARNQMDLKHRRAFAVWILLRKRKQKPAGNSTVA